MKLVDAKYVVEFAPEERDRIADYLLHVFTQDCHGVNIEIETYDVLKNLGHILAPDWC